MAGRSVPESNMFSALSKGIEGMMGDFQQIMGALQVGAQTGGLYGFDTGSGDSGPRAKGLFRGVEQLQRMNPGMAADRGCVHPR